MQFKIYAVQCMPTIMQQNCLKRKVIELSGNNYLKVPMKCQLKLIQLLENYTVVKKTGDLRIFKTSKNGDL